MNVRIIRLGVADRERAKQVFALMTQVFDEAPETLGDAYVERLLGNAAFWALAATAGDEIVGGITAHTLAMTRSESLEVFIYDIAVHADYQRRGIGRLLLSELREQAAAAGIHSVFVAADNEDSHALDFYRALGGAPAPVTIYSFD